MKIAQYILLGLTSAIFVAFVTLFVIYMVKSKKMEPDKVKRFEKILYIVATSLLVVSLVFSVINIVSAIGL